MTGTAEASAAAPAVRSAAVAEGASAPVSDPAVDELEARLNNLRK